MSVFVCALERGLLKEEPTRGDDKVDRPVFPGTRSNVLALRKPKKRLEPVARLEY